MTTTGHVEDCGVVLDWLGRATSGGVYRVARRNVDFVSWSDVHADVEKVAAHLSGRGISRGDRVGIRGENSYPWLVLDLALLRIGAVPVAFPVPSFTGRTDAELFDRYGLVAMFDGTGGGATGDDGVVDLDTLLDLPPVQPRSDPSAPQGAQVPAGDTKPFTLAFSSGTAGRVKCLLMVWSGVRKLIDTMSDAYRIGPDDRIMIALPLSTFQQRFLCYLAIRNSCSIVLTTASRYLPALRAGRPTVLLGPPNFYEFAVTRFANETWVRRGVHRAAAALAVTLPWHRLRVRWRRRVFRRYHDMFGGDVSLMLVGSAPVRREMLTFFARAGFELHQIYGMTETGYLTWNRPGASRIGSVGRETYPGTIMLDGDGEVMIAHPWHICCGYEGEDPSDVAQVFRGNNVIATGDLGYFKDGFLYLRGRKKNVIVTAGGQKVSTEELEHELADADGVNRVALVDAPDERGLAVVVWYGGDESKVRDALRSRIRKVARQRGLGIDIRYLALLEGDLGQDSPLLNRNLKLDRAAVRASTADRLEAVDW